MVRLGINWLSGKIYMQERCSLEWILVSRKQDFIYVWKRFSAKQGRHLVIFQNKDILTSR